MVVPDARRGFDMVRHGILSIFDFAASSERARGVVWFEEICPGRLGLDAFVFTRTEASVKVCYCASEEYEERQERVATVRAVRRNWYGLDRRRSLHNVGGESRAGDGTKFR